MADPAQDLRLQLLPVDLIAHGATDTLRDAGGGLVSRLVRRSDHQVIPVPRDERPDADIDPFATAAEQTYRQELSGLDVRDHGAADARFRVLAIDGNPFVSTALLWADTTAKFPGMVDAPVCAPRMSTAFVRPVRSKADAGLAELLAAVARGVAGEAQDPCSRNVFWWHRSRFHLIEFEDGDAQAVLPPELGPIVAALPD